ncbi:MAG TPA: transglycosylase SLT domain-containing protein [Candidatus Binataceae bacterium]|nr:transglycosylase SLT domain-containing protein [Candidatus Binataceae bacterium]
MATLIAFSGMARMGHIATGLTVIGLAVMFLTAKAPAVRADDWVQVKAVNTSPSEYDDSAVQPRTSSAETPERSDTTFHTSTYVLSPTRSVPPFPIRLNQFVRHYLADYRNSPGGLQGSFVRSQPYIGEMVRLMRSYGLPDDMVYLAFAESAFSKQGKGPWQFTAPTARRFGLHIDSYVDERRDPLLSTRAAAEYLATLHDASGGDWPMTLIAWNNGDTAINRYWSLRGPNFEKFGNLLPHRTRSLMGRFMAVAYIARHAESYGINTVDFDEPTPYRTLRVRGGTPLELLSLEYGISIERLHELNPALLKDVVPPYARAYSIRIPASERHAALSPQSPY